MSMTVARLIKELQTLDPKDIVMMSQDPEGNGFSPLYELGTGSVCREIDGEWCVGFGKLTAELKADGYGEDDIVRGGKPCCMLWPE